MKIIKFMERNFLISTWCFFILMLGVAWAANQHIGARTKLAELPADDDVLAIYDLSTTTGKGIEVSEFRGDNLNAIVDAESGVANPGITMYDDNGTATGTAFINGTTVDSNKDVVMSIGVEEEGSETPAVYIELDSINGTVDVNKPLTAPNIDAGIKFGSKGAAYNIETTESSVCRKAYSLFGASASVTFTLPDESVCGSGDAKEFYFVDLDNDAGDDLIVDPNGTDEIYINGVSCTDGVAVICQSDGGTGVQGNSLHITGATEGYWMVVTWNGDCDCQ